MNRITPHNFHRLALAVHDIDEAMVWLERVLGASDVPGRGSRSDPSTRDQGNLAGTGQHIVWVAGYPTILLSGGVVARFLDRYGPGVQSWAWEIDDNWSAEHLIRERGIEVVSVNVAGRFFFMHPKQTHGLLWEWCDGKMPRDANTPTSSNGLVGTSRLAWTTGLVEDADAAAEWIVGLMDAEEVQGRPRGSADVERTIDMQVGDVVVRLVTPLQPESRYAADFAERGAHVHSFALQVDDLDAALAALAGEGIETAYRSDGLAATDPSTTLGLKIDWTTG